MCKTTNERTNERKIVQPKVFSFVSSRLEMHLDLHTKYKRVWRLTVAKSLCACVLVFAVRFTLALWIRLSSLTLIWISIFSGHLFVDKSQSKFMMVRWGEDVFGFTFAFCGFFMHIASYQVQSNLMISMMWCLLYTHSQYEFKFVRLDSMWLIGVH